MDCLPEAKSGIILFVNGKEVSAVQRMVFVDYKFADLHNLPMQIRVDNPDPEITLLYFLRNQRILPSANTHIMFMFRSCIKSSFLLSIALTD